MPKSLVEFYNAEADIYTNIQKRLAQRLFDLQPHADLLTKVLALCAEPNGETFSNLFSTWDKTIRVYKYLGEAEPMWDEMFLAESLPGLCCIATEEHGTSRIFSFALGDEGFVLKIDVDGARSKLCRLVKTDEVVSTTPAIEAKTIYKYKLECQTEPQAVPSEPSPQAQP